MLNLLHGSLLETWKDLVPLPNPLHTADGEAGRGLALVDTYSVLEKLVEFDKLIRVEFTHIIRMVAGPSPTAPSDSITSRWEAIRLRDIINTHYCVEFLTIKYVSAFLQAPREPSLMALRGCTSPPGPPSSSTSGQAPAP